MHKIKSLLNNKWFFPLLILYYGIFYIIFGEVYPKLVSADGRVFLTLIWDFRKSFYFDIYYVYRILPSLIVKNFSSILSIEPVREKIVIAFQILNLACLVTSCYFLKKIFDLFKITTDNQILAFILFLFNFSILKYPFYLPVMTDTFALMSSITLLYFYLKNNIPGIIISTLMLAFSWPMGYYQGLLLIALPINVLSYTSPTNLQKRLIQGASVLFILLAIILIIYIEQRDVWTEYSQRIDRKLLPISIICLLLLYFFFAKIFLNKALWDIPLFLKKIDYKRVLMALGTFALVSGIIYLLHPKPTATYSTAQTLRDPTLFALRKPLVTIVADTSYFGIAICLLILFWNSSTKVISQMGWGIVGAIALNLFLFGITPQSRHLINLFPWLIVFLIKAINKYSFPNYFLILIGLLSLFVSKIWLVLNNYEDYPPMELDEHGCMGFPHQKLWMNLGPWMSEQMYYVQGGIILLIMAILFFTLYEIRKNSNGQFYIDHKHYLK